jgi:hypothetical protein
MMGMRSLSIPYLISASTESMMLCSIIQPNDHTFKPISNSMMNILQISCCWCWVLAWDWDAIVLRDELGWVGLVIRMIEINAVSGINAHSDQTSNLQNLYDLLLRACPFTADVILFETLLNI